MDDGRNVSSGGICLKELQTFMLATVYLWLNLENSPLGAAWLGNGRIWDINSFFKNFMHVKGR